MRSRQRRSCDDFDISCIRRVLTSIVVVRGAAQDSTLHTHLGNSVVSSAGQVLKRFLFFQSLNVPSSSILVFCGTGIYRNIDVQGKRMLMAAIESFVRRSSCFSCCINFRDLWGRISVVPRILIFQSVYLLSRLRQSMCRICFSVPGKKSQSDAMFSSSAHCRDILERCRNEFDNCRSCLQILRKNEGSNTISSYRTNDLSVISSDLQYQSVQCTSVNFQDTVTLQTDHLEDADARTTDYASGCSCAPTCLRLF